MDKKSLNSMFENLLHIGNKKNYWNPTMRNYIYGAVNGIHIINLVETEKKLNEVKETLKELATKGEKILFVATKLQSRDAFSKLATDTGNFYVSEKWVPGLLTNFRTIKRRISTYLKLLKDSESGALDILTKKEKAAKLLELDKLDKAFKGLKEMKKVPNVIFVVDSIFEKQAVKEANSLKINVFAIGNTNADSTLVTNIVPANTNSVKSIEFIAELLKSTLSGIKVERKPQGGINKMAPKRVSGDTKKTVKSTENPSSDKPTKDKKEATVKKDEKK